MRLIHGSAYRSLSAFKAREITDFLKHDTSFSVICVVFGCERHTVCTKEVKIGRTVRVNKDGGGNVRVAGCLIEAIVGTITACKHRITVSCRSFEDVTDLLCFEGR